MASNSNNNEFSLMQAEIFLRQHLHRPDITIDAVMASDKNLFQNFHVISADGDVQENLNDAGEPNQANSNIAKIYIERDNEQMFNEVQKLVAIGQRVETSNNNDGVRVCPQILRVVPANFNHCPRPTIVVTAPRHIPLNFLLRDNINLNPTFTLSVLLRSLEVLEKLHSVDYIHGDLRSEDILLTLNEEGQFGEIDNTAVHPYCGHEVMENLEFRVLLHNLEQSTLFRTRKTHNSQTMTHHKFRFIREDCNIRQGSWEYRAPNRAQNGRKIPFSRKSDLLCLLYLIIDMSSEQPLPWVGEFMNRSQGIEFETDLSTRKRMISADEMVASVHNTIRGVIRNVFQRIQVETSFSQDPGYRTVGSRVGIIDMVDQRLTELLI